MRRFFAPLLAFLLSISFAISSNAQQAPLDRETAQRIASLINAYRSEHNLPPIPYSESLTRVAEAHAMDMVGAPDGGASGSYGQDARGLPCNSHSWSNRGAWTPVCYTSDHRYAGGMWNKPREIAPLYPFPGFEVGYWTSGAVDPAQALSTWRSSASHNAVILGQGIWAAAPWRAMGVGVAGHHAFVWFGREPDPAR